MDNREEESNYPDLGAVNNERKIVKTNSLFGSW